VYSTGLMRLTRHSKKFILSNIDEANYDKND